MGDMLLAVPAFRGLRRRFREARISLVAASINTDVMLNNPYVDEVFLYAKSSHRMRPDRLMHFIRSLRSRRFDAVLVLNTVSFSITSMLLALASGARIRIGSTSNPFGHDLSSRFYHIELPLPDEAELAAMHESEHNLYPLGAIGVDERDLTSILVPSREEEEACERFVAASFADGRRFIVIHPGAGKRANIWPPERFAEVCRKLGKMHRLETVVVRGPVDREAFDSFLHAAEYPRVALSSPSVGFLGALMKRAAVTLCNDTGVMHIAGAVGGCCAAVFGPTDPSRWKPAGDHVIAVQSSDRRIDSVTVDAVYAAAERLLARSTGERGGS
jgi:heptosyltransferase-2/heptosyltransferase-3